MKVNPLAFTMCLLAIIAPVWAGEDIPLDKDFSFRLTEPELRPPCAAPTPDVSVRPEHRRDNPPSETPLGEPLPPGTRPFKFNGQTYYFIPL